jgi:hypothetical protein
VFNVARVNKVTHLQAVCSHANLQTPQIGWELITIITATWEAEIQRIEVPGQSRQKVRKNPISVKNLGKVVHTCHPGYPGSLCRRVTVQDQPVKKV